MDGYGEKHISKNKIFALVLTLFVISILVVAGPANAFLLSFETSKTNAQIGDKIIFTLSAEAENKEYSNVDFIILNLDGPINSSCKFYPNGTIISGCSMMSIEITDREYGYGYGYGYGYDKFLSYKITLDTSYYLSGIYSTRIIVSADGKDFSKKGDNINIHKKSGGGGQNLNINGCSIRAKGGELSVNNSIFDEFKKSKLVLNFNKKGIGHGSITAQNKRNRFSYVFDVIQVLENSQNNFKVLVSGNYKTNRLNKIGQTAIITIDIKDRELDLTSNEIDMNGMDITFSTKCNVAASGNTFEIESEDFFEE